MPGDHRTAATRIVSASELAEYSFCPRAHYYRTHPDGRPAPPDSEIRSAAGIEFHRRTLSADRRWSGTSALPWWVALVAGILLAVVVVLGALP